MVIEYDENRPNQIVCIHLERSDIRSNSPVKFSEDLRLMDFLITKEELRKAPKIDFQVIENLFLILKDKGVRLLFWEVLGLVPLPQNRFLPELDDQTR